MAKFFDMCGREVVLNDVPKETHRPCADCGQKAIYQVIELKEFPPATRQPKIWYWCGKCCIGG